MAPRPVRAPHQCGFGADRRRGPRKHLAPKPTRCVPIESTSAVAGGSTRRGAGATCARRESYGSVVRRTGVRPWPARVTHRWRGPRPPARSDGARGLESVNDESRRSKSKTRPVGVVRLASRGSAVIFVIHEHFLEHEDTRQYCQPSCWCAAAGPKYASLTDEAYTLWPAEACPTICMPNVLPS